MGSEMQKALAFKADEQMEPEVCELVLEQQAENEKKVTPAKLLRMIELQEFRCALSGVQLTPSDSSLDHKTPLSKGGSHTICNVEFVHPVINRMKGTLTREEFVSWCRKVAQWQG